MDQYFYLLKEKHLISDVSKETADLYFSEIKIFLNKIHELKEIKIFSRCVKKF